MHDLRISLIQTILHWEDKAANLEMLQKKIAVITGKPMVVILPEMFSTGFSMTKESLAETMDGTTIEWMKKNAAENKTVITGSMIAREDRDGITAYYNRLIWMLPNGDYGLYDKRHLFAYGREDRHFSAGSRRLVAQIGGWKVALQICYDLRFPVWLRQSKTAIPQEAPEFDLMIVVANWPSARSLAWRTLLRARAIENQCYVAGVNRTGTDGNGLQYAGESMIVGPLGEIIGELGAEEEVLSNSLDYNILQEVRLKFPFWRDADQFFIQP